MKHKEGKSFDRQSKAEKGNTQIDNKNNILIHSYWFFAIMIVIASSMFVDHSSVKLGYQNTYHTIYFHYLTIMISIVFLLFGFIYWSQRNRPLRAWMTNTHTLITMGIVGTFYMTCFQESTWDVTPILIFGVVPLAIAQVILVANLVWSKPN